MQLLNCRFKAIIIALLISCASTDGRADNAIKVERLGADESIKLDGTLNHPAWQRATLFDDFIERNPKNGAAPNQRTTARVLMDERALYFGIEAFDTSPEKIRAPMVRHDGVDRTHDFVAVYVDAVGARKAAQFFRVNAAGSTADGLHSADNDNEDFAPDYDFDAAASINNQGYTAVFRIPLTSLRYGRDSGQTWKTMVVRRLPREQTYLIASVAIPADVLSFIATMQPLEGVAKPEHESFLIVRPTLALRRSTQDGITETNKTLGAEIKWRPAPEWVVDATIKPDFSQVELDVPQLSRNTRFAQSLTEKRPFFLESSDLLQTPTSALYTRSVTQPRWGARVNWRGESAAGTGLVLADEGGGTVLLPHAFNTDYATQPAYNGATLRARADDPDYSLGMLATTRKYADGKGKNTVLGVDGTGELAPAWKWRAQVLASNTTAQANEQGELQQGDASHGRQLVVSVNHKSHEWEAAASTAYTSKNYRNDSGFTVQADARDLSGNINRIWRNIESPVGPLDEFWIYLWASRTDWLENSRMISGYITPGFFIGAGRNTEITLEYRRWDWARLSADKALQRQDHLHLEFATQPAEWWSRFSLNADAGRLLDYSQDVLRPGVKFSVNSPMRAHRLLEVEPQLSQVILKGNGAIAYRESAAQLLSVLHLSATQKLRYIGQQTLFTAQNIPRDTRTTHSLTYSWRKSAGTVAYIGASNNRSDLAGNTLGKGTELFAKIQIDPQEFGWFR